MNGHVHTHLFNKYIEHLLHAGHIVSSYQPSRVERLQVLEPDRPGFESQVLCLLIIVSRGMYGVLAAHQALHSVLMRQE